jgi:oligopeptide/dipeptide ABC transporter ATP-binding protein
MALLKIQDLRISFHTRRGIARAVNGLSLEIEKGETLCLVGESGSGKSVSQMSYLGLLPKPPMMVDGGRVEFEGTDLLSLSPAQLRFYRGNQISMIFQEPMTSLNPYLRIGYQVAEPLMIHNKSISRADALKQAQGALERVGIRDSAHALTAYPHEFSGGMRQRVMIAMSLLTRPKLLIADEPTTALDVTVQAQILDLLKDLQKETGMSILFITHDLGVVAGIADKVVVMYGGRSFEYGGVEDIFYRSQHPYTRALLRSMPRVDLPANEIPSIPGMPPDITRLKSGCPFFDRCSYKKEICEHTFPEQRSLSPNHLTYCHVEHVEELAG